MPTASVSLKQRASDPTSKPNWQASRLVRMTAAQRRPPFGFRLPSRAIAADRIVAAIIA
jgi:hypothetical protein